MNLSRCEVELGMCWGCELGSAWVRFEVGLLRDALGGVGARCGFDFTVLGLL